MQILVECSSGMLHAEIAALLPVINKFDLSQAVIYVYRENKLGQLAICRPCKGCMSFIKACGIKKSTILLMMATLKNIWRIKYEN